MCEGQTVWTGEPIVSPEEDWMKASSLGSLGEEVQAIRRHHPYYISVFRKSLRLAVIRNKIQMHPWSSLCYNQFVWGYQRKLRLVGP